MPDLATATQGRYADPRARRRALTLAPPDAGALVARRPIGAEAMLLSSTGGAVWGAAVGMALGVGWNAASVGVLGLAAALATPGLLRAARAWAAQLRLRFTPVTTRLDGVARGRPVRLRGVVESGAAFVSPGSGAQAVLAAYRGKVLGLAPDLWLFARRRIEIRGIDFVLSLGPSDRVHVQVLPSTDFLHGLGAGGDEEGQLASRTVWTTPTTAVLCVVEAESAIGPGDEIEVLGTLDRVVDPHGERAGPRSAPMRTVVRGTPAAPLLVRRLRPA